MQFTSQSTTYLVFFVISTIINLICTSVIYGLNGFLFYCLFLLISIPFTILLLYNINCLTYGNCNTWSWIFTILNVLTLIGVCISMIVLVFFKDDITTTTIIQPTETVAETDKKTETTIVKITPTKI